MDYVEKIEEGDGDLKKFTKAYETFGIHIQDDNSVIAKEWAPGAQEVLLTGDFSKNYIHTIIFTCYISELSFNYIIFCFIDNWHWLDTPYKKLEYGKWELHLPPNADGSCPLKHLSEVKIIIKDHNNELLERLSPWANYVVQAKNKSQGTTYKQIIWHPENVLNNYYSKYFLYL